MRKQAAIFGALIGLMSLSIASQPGDHSLEYVRDPQVRILGTYQVRDVVRESMQYRGTTCRPYNDGRDQPADENCNQYVWLIRKGEELALIRAPEGSVIDPVYVNTFVLRPNFSIFHPTESQCLSRETVFTVREDLFGSQFCRAVHAPSADTNEFESFAFNPDNSDPWSEAYANALKTLPLPIGVGSGYSIKLSRKHAFPPSAEVQKVFAGVVLGISAKITTRYLLERVGD